MASNLDITLKRHNGTDIDNLYPTTTWSQVESKPSTFTPTSHTHGNITNGGAIGSTANLMVKTTTSGVLTTLAAGTTSQFLRGDGVWATPADSTTLSSLGITATASELNYTDGVTSNIQTQLNGKVSKAGDTMTNRLVIDYSATGGDGTWDKSGILIKNANVTEAETALAMQTAGTGTNLWIQGLNQNGEMYKWAYGNGFTDANVKMDLSSAGVLRVGGQNVVLTNDSRLSDSRTPLAHTHDDRYFTETEADARFLGISAKAADSNLLDGLDLNSTTRNNEVNKVMRTDANGYANFGWINTTSGNTTNAVADVYVNTGDGYIRKKTLALFKTELGSMPASDVYAWAKAATKPAYTAAEVDALADTHAAAGVTTTKIGNWDTAYGWGNHASVGYLTSLPSHTLTSHSDVTTDTPSLGQVLKWNGTAWAPGADNNTTYSLASFGITATADEINKIDGFTGAYTDLNYAKDLKATGVTTTEFDYLDGVTSNIQTQINAKTNTTLGGSSITEVAYSVSGSTLTITLTP